MTTPKDERARLAGVYSAMSDEELRKIALSHAELTSIAQEALAAEAARRGLDLNILESDGSPEAEEPEAALPLSEEEQRRVASVYSTMGDGELEQLAAAGFDLSQEARRALQAEISHRGLNFVIATEASVDLYEMSDMVTLRKFRDLPEALLAKGGLESAGIESQLIDDNMIRMDWFISNLLGGIKLKVHAKDVEAAHEILNQPIPENLDVEGIGEYEQPKCPKCRSLDVSYRELEKFASYGSAYLGIPVPVHKKAWSCHACRNEWQETETGDAITNTP